MMNDELVAALQRVKHSQDVIACATALENRVETLRLDLHRSLIANGGELSAEFRRGIDEFLSDTLVLQDLVADNSLQTERLPEIRTSLLQWSDLAKSRCRRWRFAQAKLAPTSKPKLGPFSNRFAANEKSSTTTWPISSASNNNS